MVIGTRTANRNRLYKSAENVTFSAVSHATLNRTQPIDKNLSGDLNDYRC